MERKPARILRQADIAREARWFTQRLNPRSRFLGSGLGRVAGLSHTGVSHSRLPPGAESFALHAHRYEEEWIYILEGRPTLLLEGGEVELGPGDFVAFPAPQKAHNLANRTEADVVYLMGGDSGRPLDVIDYPSLGKTYLLERVPGAPTSFHELSQGEHPFGPLDTK
jgi:uncharacterized cupin superfamily protein